MSSKARRTAITKNSVRAAQIGAAVFRQRSTDSPSDDPTTVQPFPIRMQDRSKDIAVRLRFLLSRQSRGETHWGSRILADAIADCRVELHQAKQLEGRH